MKFLKTVLFLFFVPFSGWAQINQMNLDVFITEYNSFSLSRDGSVRLIGGKSAVKLFANGDEPKLLKGTHAFINERAQIIYTFSAIGKLTSRLYLYTLKGDKIKEIDFKGTIKALTTSEAGSQVYFILSREGDDDKVICYNSENDSSKSIFKGRSEFTTINRLGRNNLAVSGGGESFIFTLEGKIIKVISAPHRSFGKVTMDGNFFCILQEISDASSVEVYDSTGTQRAIFRYFHSTKPTMGTRRCATCITKESSFIDFDVSPDLRFLVGVDQFYTPICIDSRGRLIENYGKREGSNDWRFFSFTGNRSFLCVNISSNSIEQIELK